MHAKNNTYTHTFTHASTHVLIHTYAHKCTCDTQVHTRTAHIFACTDMHTLTHWQHPMLFPRPLPESSMLWSSKHSVCPIVLGSSSGDCSPLSQELSRGHASGGVRLYLGDAHWGGLLMPTQVRGTWGLGAHPTYGTSDGLMQPWAERRASCSPPHWRGPTSTSLRS